VKWLSTRMLKCLMYMQCLAKLTAVNVKHIVCTKITFCIVDFQTWKLFLPVVDDFRKMAHFNVQEMTMGDHEEC